MLKLSTAMSNYFNAQIGFGTSGLAENNHHWDRDKQALHYAIEVGYKVFDTAEMYSNGQTEIMLGEVLKESGCRDRLHIVSKVLPVNALTKESIMACCRASIARMKCDYIDTYLLHWRSPDNLPLLHIIEAFVELQQMGLIKKYGVSNFGKGWMTEWMAIEKQLGADTFVTNQCHYSVTQRKPENYLTWMQENNLTFMAFSPLSNNRNQLLNNQQFLSVAQDYSYTPAELALAWTIRNSNVIAIPKSIQHKHIKDNLMTTNLQLNKEIVDKLNQLFPCQN